MIRHYAGPEDPHNLQARHNSGEQLRDYICLRWPQGAAGSIGAVEAAKPSR
jgi:hypothetical protein